MEAKALSYTASVSSVQTRLSWFHQFGLLLRVLVTDIRSAAPFLLLMGIVLPLGLFWIMNKYVGVGPESHWLLAGNIVMTVSFGSVSFSIQRTALMKIEGELDYYGSLSVHKGAFMAAVFVESIIFAIPALLSSLVIGYVFLGVPLATLLIVAPIAMLAASSMTIVGNTLGSHAKHMGHFAIFSYLPYLAVTFLSPVLLPLEQLPVFLKITSYLLPTGEAALVLTEVLNNTFEMKFWIFLGALLLWLFIAIFIASRKLDWRSN
ncbi:ABC transporter permease [Paenibacillus sp. SI8]|uniref:ABC transporter permease n=1 Tax=unclassified Paenibacillus TaxID=185978 RepID=UPI003466C7D1